MKKELKKLYDSWDTKEIVCEILPLCKELIDNTDGNGFKKWKIIKGNKYA